MLEEIGPENVVHVVTDNGSNYKKACKELLSEVYEHIAWTPCLAHTVNLMLKDTFQRMTDLQSAVQALQEFDMFRQKVGEYGSEMAMRMAMDPKTSPCKSYSI